jgi:spore maturation protein B
VKGLLLPGLLLLAALPLLLRGKPLYGPLTEGFREGLGTVYRIFPPLAATLTAVSMFRASGGMEALTGLLAPLLRSLGIPPEAGGLLLLRPLSGSGALAFAAELIGRWGPDSPQGRYAAVMLGSTETTFYTVSVYFGAAGIRRTRHAIPAALVSDLTGALCAGIFIKLFFG